MADSEILPLSSPYRADLIRRFWTYHASRFPGQATLLDRLDVSADRPPVFAKQHRHLNVLTPSGRPADAEAVLNTVKGRHRWFGSMSSSQALAQSVFGNLFVHGQLGLLSEVEDDLGRALVSHEVLASTQFRLEAGVAKALLGEPRPTSLDVLFDGPFKVAFECKLTEQEVGTCSRPRQKRDEVDYCDGTYPLNRMRAGVVAERCPLREKGRQIAYWDYVPKIFSWPVDDTMAACPLNANYQLVRNVLAVSVDKQAVSPSRGRAVLIYDERNPAFQPGGKGWIAFGATRAALHPPYAGVLSKCSWQRIVARLRLEPRLDWLTEALQAKYGFS